jgi:DNA-binding transcriptional LysR family regulator
MPGNRETSASSPCSPARQPERGGAQLGITTPAVSKLLALRSPASAVAGEPHDAAHEPDTRRRAYLESARRILADIGDMEELLGVAKATPKGLLRVNATLGFGRSHVAPLISRFVRKHPQVEVQLQLSVHPPPLTEDAVRRLHPLRRAARRARHRALHRAESPPAVRVARYLAKHGVPKTPGDLARHNCIGIRQGEEAYGVWRLASGRGKGAAVESVKIRGNLATNDGEIAVNWALDGHGILMRAEWDIDRYLRSGRLVHVLPQYHTPDADIHAVYPQRHQLAARVRAFVDFVACRSRSRPPPASDSHPAVPMPAAHAGVQIASLDRSGARHVLRHRQAEDARPRRRQRRVRVRRRRARRDAHRARRAGDERHRQARDLAGRQRRHVLRRPRRGRRRPRHADAHHRLRQPPHRLSSGSTARRRCASAPTTAAARSPATRSRSRRRSRTSTSSRSASRPGCRRAIRGVSSTTRTASSRSRR